MTPTPHHVVLLHGLSRSKLDMLPLSIACKRAGLTVHNFGYHSRHGTISAHSEQLQRFLSERSLNNVPLNFIAHSLGGLIVRKLCETSQGDFNWGRAVFLGTPYHGARIARIVQQTPLKYFFGPALADIGNTPYSSHRLPLEVAVITGGTRTKIGFLPILGGDNDLLVRVEEAQYPHATSSSVVRVPHFALMFAPAVIRASVKFISTGEEFAL